MKSTSSNDAFKVKVLFPEYCEFDDAYHMLPLGLVINYHVKNTFKDTAKMISKFLCIILSRLSKSWFIHIKKLILSGDNSTNFLFYFYNGIGYHCYDQVLLRNKSLFGSVCCMAKDPFLWVYISTCPDKHSHGGNSDYEVSIGAIPDIFCSFTTHSGTPSNIMIQVISLPTPNSTWVFIQSPESIICHEIVNE